MKRFGVLGAVVFALLVTASPAMAFNSFRVYRGSGTATLHHTLTLPKTGYYRFTGSLSASTGTCDAIFDLPDKSYAVAFPATQTTTIAVSQHYRAGEHPMRLVTDCAWRLTVWYNGR